MSPTSILANQKGLASGDMAMRVARFNGQPTLIVLMPCAAFTVEVTAGENTLDPAPETLETVLADCHFPWDDNQARMERSLKEPLPFERRGNDILLHIEESASTLVATPYVG
ncbi:hypothetical protein ACW0JT_04085 [Arthrobacter sp. SA17]